MSDLVGNHENQFFHFEAHLKLINPQILEKDGQWQSVAIAYEMREEAKRISDQEVAALR